MGSLIDNRKSGQAINQFPRNCRPCPQRPGTVTRIQIQFNAIFSGDCIGTAATVSAGFACSNIYASTLKVIMFKIHYSRNARNRLLAGKLRMSDIILVFGCAISFSHLTSPGETSVPHNHWPLSVLPTTNNFQDSDPCCLKSGKATMIADLYRLRWFPQAAMRLRGGVSDGPRSPKRNYGPRGSSSPRGMPSLAHAGEPQPGDWRCPPCGMSNYRRRIACFRCGTLRDSNVASVVTSPLRQDSPNRGGPSRLGFLPEDMERGRQIAFKEARRSMVRVSFTLNLWVRRFATVFRFATVRCAIARNLRP